MTEIIQLFLKLGAIGFGGPIAMIGFMEHECVKKRNWMTEAEYHRIVAVAKLFPGPLAVLIAVRIGKMRLGTMGGIAAGVCLILPAFLMILGLAGLASTLDRYSILNPFWLGLTLAALALATHATVNLTLPLFKSRTLPNPTLFTLIFSSAALTFYAPRLEALFIISFGSLGLLSDQIKKIRPKEVASIGILTFLALACFRASIFTFGSGIAVVPVLQNVFIDQHHLISNAEFLRGLTLAQITPGPILVLATFLGFSIAGVSGALATTFGTFLPTFFFGTFLMPRVENTFLKSEKLKTFFSWLLPAVCGAILGSLVRLGLLSIRVEGQFYTGRALLLTALILIQLKWKLSPAKLFFIGGASAYLIS